MARAGSTLTAGFVLTVAIGCGLETVELGGSGLRDKDAGLPVEPTPLPVDGEAVPPPNTTSPLTEGRPEVAPIANGPDIAGANFDELPVGRVSGCTKVDFLFVIDNSFSMLLAQQNLKDSFGGFMGVIGQQLGLQDFHIMVVDSDGGDGDAEDEEAPADRCQDVLGAGRRAQGNGRDCGLPEGQRFIQQSPGDAIDVAQRDLTFECMASVGNSGDSDELTIDAMLASVSSENGPGGCNEGFLRDDALLVVTLITNSDDVRSNAEPPDWVAGLTSLKGGDEAAFVALGFLRGNDLEGAQCDLLAQVLNIGDAPRLQEFVNSFSHSRLASVCADNYAPFFDEAVSKIDLACDEFNPR